MPNTVVGALVENGTYPDPFFGMNLRSLPGMTYPVGQRTSRSCPCRRESPFARSWWYRKEFDLPAAHGGRAVFLHFDGINYRANIWFNGQRLADAREAAGAFRRYSLDVTRWARPGARNAVAVEVFAPERHRPRRDVGGLEPHAAGQEHGPVERRVRDGQRPHRPAPTRTWSRGSTCRRSTSPTSPSPRRRSTPPTGPCQGTLRGAIGEIRFEQPVALGPREKKVVRFTPATTPVLDVRNPRLWWPYRMGDQNLHTLLLEIEADGAVSDRQQARFGIREVTSELTDKGHRLFRVNGRPILDPRRRLGLGHDAAAASSERLRAEMRYVKEMGLNTIRSEGKFESDEFFDLADEEGILLMIGWCCCDHWETWAKWDAEDHRVAVASLGDQTRRLRNHPSVFVWTNGSDGPPPPAVEKAYLDELDRVEWSAPVLSNATDKPGIGRTLGREDARALRIRAAVVLAPGHEERRGLRLRHRGQPRRGGAARSRA